MPDRSAAAQASRSTDLNNEVVERFPRVLDQVPAVYAFVHRFLLAHGISGSAANDIHLATEEIFTNFVKYNNGGQGDIRVAVRHLPTTVVVTLIDPDTHEFDITVVPPLTPSEHLDQRKVGGLGIHFVRKVMDEVHYRYHERTAEITLCKHLESDRAEHSH